MAKFPFINLGRADDDIDPALVRLMLHVAQLQDLAR